MDGKTFKYLPTPGTGGAEKRPPDPPGKYPCPCCGHITFPVPKEEAVAFICSDCGWENDVFDSGEDSPSDENRGLTLRQGRVHYEKFGKVCRDLREEGVTTAAALEYNDHGCLLWALDCPGAFARGRTREEAEAKLPADVAAWCRWAGWELPLGPVAVTEENDQPDLNVADADSDMIFAGERAPMTRREYDALRALVLRSARDLDALYAAIPDPDAPLAPARGTFYGAYPNTARAMFEHTNGVTNYYVGELGAEAEPMSGCYEYRLKGLAALEALPDFPDLPVTEGSYGELWSLRKVLRRFLWHDRIHARAMYRRAKAVWGEVIPDPFRFDS